MELSQNSVLVNLSFLVPMKDNCFIDTWLWMSGPRPPS